MSLVLIPLNSENPDVDAIPLPGRAGAWSFGSGRDNDLRIAHDSVSDRHALIECEALDGGNVGLANGSRYFLRDAGSGRGTLLDGKAVERAELKGGGEVIAIGLAEFRVERREEGEKRRGDEEESGEGERGGIPPGAERSSPPPGENGSVEEIEPGRAREPLSAERVAGFGRSLGEAEISLEEPRKRNREAVRREAAFEEEKEGLTDQLAQVRQSLESARAARNEERQQRKAAEQGVAELEGKIVELTETSTRHEADIAAASARREAALEEEKTRLAEQLAQVQQSFESTWAAWDEERQQREAAERRIAELEREIADSADASTRREAELSAAAAEREAALQQEKASLEKNFDALGRERQADLAALEWERQRNQEAAQREAAFLKERNDLRARIRARDSDIEEKSAALAERNERIAGLEQSVAEWTAACERLQAAQDESLAALSNRDVELFKAREAREKAEAFAADTAGRVRALCARLLEDWKAWVDPEEISAPPVEEARSGDFGGIDEAATGEAFAGMDRAADRVREELALIEPIWREFGEGIQEELRRRCDELREEIREREELKARRQGELEETTTDLEDLRHFLDDEIRAAQKLNRGGGRVRIPERFGTLTIARATELEIFRLLIDYLEEFERQIAKYRRSRRLRHVAARLGGFRDRLVGILQTHGVEAFSPAPGVPLEPGQANRVQVVEREGWRSSKTNALKFQPGEVAEVVRPGYQINGAVHPEILRKAEVLIK